MLVPPALPMASTYGSPIGLPQILPGPGCSTELGPGVGPATQAGFHPAGQDATPSQLVQPTAAEAQVPGAGGTAMPPSQPASFALTGGTSWLLFPLSLGVLLALSMAWSRRSPRSKSRWIR